MREVYLDDMCEAGSRLVGLDGRDLARVLDSFNGAADLWAGKMAMQTMAEEAAHRAARKSEQNGGAAAAAAVPRPPP